MSPLSSSWHCCFHVFPDMFRTFGRDKGSRLVQLFAFGPLRTVCVNCWNVSCCVWRLCQHINCNDFSMLYVMHMQDSGRALSWTCALHHRTTNVSVARLLDCLAYVHCCVVCHGTNICHCRIGYSAANLWVSALHHFAGHVWFLVTTGRLIACCRGFRHFFQCNVFFCMHMQCRTLRSGMVFGLTTGLYWLLQHFQTIVCNAIVVPWEMYCRPTAGELRSGLNRRHWAHLRNWRPALSLEVGKVDTRFNTHISLYICILQCYDSDHMPQDQSTASSSRRPMQLWAASVMVPELVAAQCTMNNGATVM